MMLDDLDGSVQGRVASMETKLQTGSKMPPLRQVTGKSLFHCGPLPRLGAHRNAIRRPHRLHEPAFMVQ